MLGILKQKEPHSLLLPSPIPPYPDTHAHTCLYVLCRSVAASFAQMHIHSTAQVADLAAPAAAAEGAAAAAAAAAGDDSMAALEAAAEEAAAVMQRGTKLSGFVSAGVIQQGADKDKAAQQQQQQQQEAAQGGWLSWWKGGRGGVPWRSANQQVCLWHGCW